MEGVEEAQAVGADVGAVVVFCEAEVEVAGAGVAGGDAAEAGGEAVDQAVLLREICGLENHWTDLTLRCVGQ